MKQWILVAAICMCPAAATAVDSYGPADFWIVEDRLKAAGYDIDKPDGVLDERDILAIVEYQRDWETPETGRVDLELVRRLLRKHSVTKGRWESFENCNRQIWNGAPKPREKVTLVDGCEGAKVRWDYVLRGKAVAGSYSGGWRNGSAHGFGVLRLGSGGSYRGGFRDGKYHGYGRLNDQDKNAYSGTFFDGQMSGHGVARMSNGSFYIGEIVDGLENGFGAQFWPNGERYIGQFKHGLRSGVGKYYWPNGVTYEGGYKRDKRHGHGISFIPDGTIIIGNHVRDAGNGHAVIFWKDGHRFLGNLRNHIAHGYGAYIFDDGEVLSGNWLHGCLRAGETWFSFRFHSEDCNWITLSGPPKQ